MKNGQWVTDGKRVGQVFQLNDDGTVGVHWHDSNNPNLEAYVLRVDPATLTLFSVEQIMHYHALRRDHNDALDMLDAAGIWTGADDLLSDRVNAVFTGYPLLEEEAYRRNLAEIKAARKSQG